MRYEPVESQSGAVAATILRRVLGCTGLLLWVGMGAVVLYLIGTGTECR